MERKGNKMDDRENWKDRKIEKIKKETR